MCECLWGASDMSVESLYADQCTCVCQDHTRGDLLPWRWLSPLPLVCGLGALLSGSHLLETLRKHCVCCVLQAGSARDGRAPGAPPTSPLPLTVGAAAVPKWSRSPSVRSAFYAVCCLSFTQQPFCRWKLALFLSTSEGKHVLVTLRHRMIFMSVG